MSIYVSSVLDEKIFLNVDFFNKESLIEIDVNEDNEQTVTLDKNNIQNNFGITIHTLYDFDYNKEIIVNIELLFTGNITGNLKYFDGEKYIIDNNQIIENNMLKANIHLNCWNKKCRFFIDNLNIDIFIIKKFMIKDINNKILFTQELWSPKMTNHYSLVKGIFLYNELTKIFYKTDIFMIINNKYKINYKLPNIKYYHVDNINAKSKILYLFIVNSEYYNNLISNKFLKESIENNLIKTIFRSCFIPKDFKYNNGIFFIQNKNMGLPKSFQTILNSNEDTVNSCMQKEKELNLKNRIYVNTMGISSNVKYYNNSYNDNKIHILFIGRLTRPFNLIEYINNIDNLLDHKKYIIDILPGTLELNGEKLNSSNIEHFNIIKSFFNKTINLLPSVPQHEVFEYILKSDIAIDFPVNINSLSIKGPENSKLYEYISGGLPTVSQLTPNSYFINKYNCGIELNTVSTPNDYYNAIIKLSKNIEQYDRENIAINFIKDYSYNNLTYMLIRSIMNFYKELPKELLGDWNFSEDKITLDTPYLKNHKFLIRDRTIKSNWDRLLKHFPDLFCDEKKSFLDFSCGNGATLEILRFLGHNSFGVDYESENHCFDKPLFHSTMEMNNKWPYKILLESQNLDFKGHDLNVIPYPFEDNSFDIVNSWGAIEFYGRPKYWKVFILEMLRISKEYVNISFNDISPWLKDNEEYIQEYNTFFNEIENILYDYNVKIEKISDKHYKFYKNKEITDIIIKKSVNDVIKVPFINIIILIDVYEWAYHYDALDMKKCLEDYSDVSVHIILFDDFYSDKNNYNNYDLVYVLCAYKLKDIEESKIVVSKTNIFITSHYSYKIINNILNKCKYCFVVNSSISSEFKMYADTKNINKIYIYKNFWNNDIFYKKQEIKKAN
jgi:SAM-dependent methyltransferase